MCGYIEYIYSILQYESLLTHLVPDREKRWKKWDCKLDTWPIPIFGQNIYTLWYPVDPSCSSSGDCAQYRPLWRLGWQCVGQPLGGVFEVGLSLKFEPGDPTKKKERTNWFERWFAERSFYVFVRGSEKIRSTWCLKKQGPAFDLGRLLNSETCGFGGNVIKPYVKPLFPGFRLFYLYSLFILPLLVRSEGIQLGLPLTAAPTECPRWYSCKECKNTGGGKVWEKDGKTMENQDMLPSNMVA